MTTPTIIRIKQMANNITAIVVSVSYPFRVAFQVYIVDPVTDTTVLQTENGGYKTEEKPVAMFDDFIGTPGVGEIDENWQPDSHWEDHPAWPFCDWADECKANDTRLGYVEWVNHCLDQR